MRIKFEQSKRMELIGGAGLSLAAQVLHGHTTLAKDLTRQFPKRSNGLPTGDVVTAYLACLCLGKSDFEAVRTLEDRVLSPETLGIAAFPSPESVRQRLDEGADLYLPYVQKASLDLVRRAKLTGPACTETMNEAGIAKI